MCRVFDCKEFKVEVLQGTPKHSDIKKLLKSDFNFIKGICMADAFFSGHSNIYTKYCKRLEKFV